MTEQEYQQAKQAANDWRYLMTLVSIQLPDTHAKLMHSKRTTKGDLDAWLMRCFGLSPVDARSVSNYSGEVIEYRIGNGRVTWVARRPAPTFEQYPELAALMTVEKAFKGSN